MPKTFEHKKTGWNVTFIDITQGQLEAYFRLHRELKAENASSTESFGAIVRAAIQAGWLGEHQGADPLGMPVEALAPAFVKWLAGRIDEVYVEATTIPPE